MDAATRSTGHRIGPDDLLEIVVFEAPELNRSVRVSSSGSISLPLLGDIRVTGLTPRELQTAVEERLRRRYIHDPHVSVQVSEIQNQPVSVVGAVNRPGVYGVRGARPLIEVLALAGGLSSDAGESLLVVRPESGTSTPDSGSPGASQEIPLTALLESGDSRYNVLIHPGDVVKVKPAGAIYIVGEVNQPGVFPLTASTGVTLLQAVALGEGLLPTAATGRAVIIRTNPAGERVQIRVDLGRVLAGRAADPQLQPKDIVFIPASSAKSISLGLVDVLVRMVTLRAVF